MAGETRGAALEAIVAFAISRASKYNASAIFWDEKIPELNWKPDFFIYPSQENAGLMCLVTYAGSETDSRQKFWRNLAEYFDVKLRYPNIVTISFVTGISREKQISLQKHIFNSVIILDEIVTKKDINRIIKILESGKIVKKEKSTILNELYESDKVFANLIDSMSNLINNTPLLPDVHSSFWMPIGHESKSAIPLQLLRFRRGIAKSILLNPLERTSLLHGNRIAKMPHHYGLIRAGILNRIEDLVYLKDEDIVFALENTEHLDKIIDKYTKPTGVSVAENLHDLGRIEGALEWITAHIDLFKSADTILGILRNEVDSQPDPAIIYSAIKLILKLYDDESWINDLAERSGEMRSVLVGLILPKFERGEEDLKHTLKEHIAIILSHRLPVIFENEVDLDLLVDRYIRGEIENRLVCHGIDGVGALIMEHLVSKSIKFKNMKLSSGLSEDMSFSANDFSTRGILINNKTYVHWKTVTQEGRGHKTKELSARIYQARRTVKKSEFIKRENPSKYILIVDGDWDKNDFIILSQFGWDAIIPADRLDLIDTYI